jgi:ATP-dependent helicase/nuclease subunit A
VCAALATLKQYHRWTRVLPAAAALERILEHTGYLALASTTPGGVEAGDLLHALDRVRQVVEEGGSLADAADALEDDSDESSEVESLPLQPGRSDVVRVMNLHKAKGLEADVVFLADPSGGFKPRVDVHIARDGAQAQGWFRVERRWEGTYGSTLLGEHADWPTHEDTELPYLQAEEDRLLYVAATRAREMLVVSRWPVKPAGTSAWGELNKFLSDATELAVPETCVPATVKPAECSSELQVKGETARAAVHARVNQPSWSMTSVTAEARHIARMTRTVEPAADDPSRVFVADTPTHRADAGMAWGTLIHGLLEHAMRHPGATREDLRRLAMWLTVEEPALRPVLDRAVNTVQKVAAADFWREAGAAHAVHAEVPFMLASAGTGRPVLLNGVIDLVFGDGASWQIIDYKTDAGASPDELAARYRDQLNAYEKAWQTIAGGAVQARIVGTRSSDSSSRDGLQTA